MGQRAAAAHREDRRRHRASSSRCTPRRSTTTRRSRSSRPATSSRAGRAWARGSATAWAARTRTCRRSSCCSSQAHATTPTSRCSRGCGAAASCRRAPGRALPQRRRPGALPRRTRRASSRDAPARCSTRSAELNQLQLDDVGDPEIDTRIAQYEMAFRMQTRVPELTDLSNEPESTSSSCTAPTSRKPGTFAANCLLARRLAERGVRFIQLYHRGWDQHGNLPRDLALPVPRHRPAVRGADHRPEAARPARRHAGRLGRRVRPHGLLPGQADRRRTTAATITRAASRMWMAGGGIKPGIVYGETDDFSYNVVDGPGPRPRPPRHDPAPARHRPHAADLQVPGPRLPADRRARQRREADPGVEHRCQLKPNLLKCTRGSTCRAGRGRDWLEAGPTSDLSVPTDDCPDLGSLIPDRYLITSSSFTRSRFTSMGPSLIVTRVAAVARRSRTAGSRHPSLSMSSSAMA